MNKRRYFNVHDVEKDFLAVEGQNKLIDRLIPILEISEGKVTQFETHISRVLVAGRHAFKFKKAIRLAFLDFSTLEARRFYCQEEYRLNRRLAPDIYIDVMPVTGSAEQPAMGGAGETLEYAVRMHAFEQQALWSHLATLNLLTLKDIDDLALKLARFHLDSTSAPFEATWGTPQTIAATSADTLSELSRLVMDERSQHHVTALQHWTAEQGHKLDDTFQERRAQGMVRECHGDLHCGNVLTVNGKVQVFDCIEFNDKLRWIDVMNDLAFIHMDLAFRQRDDLAARLLNQYLEVTGDYPGLKVLPYYRTHRALVRAEVMLLRACQPDLPAQDAEACKRDGLAYLAFARQCSRPKHTAIMITHGYSGSGKTTFARCLVQLLGAIQVRSDVERKRMHGISGSSRTDVPSGDLLYSAAATQKTYEHLRSLARRILDAQWPVIIDAACLKAAQRYLFLSLAEEIGVPFFIFDMRASREAMTNRIVLREKISLDASDADVGVLESQLRDDEPLTAEEKRHAIVVDTESGTDLQMAKKVCTPVLSALAANGNAADGFAITSTAQRTSTTH